ncbi:MOSC domain-containing protein [Halochromatium glycolicum]|jgi:MOSC domain-containing protein YiiM|uniref:MOSC domain-containing protein n=1 Tax=Halochromatium glycolicum TaxID=85075 RepID=A0AAJ0U4A1_9GAMM|nr:MOSC domain-containing protein [Halochromatium glycolicum]MBK1705011.1 MOSC domain-containing protein [Halochromatium glycolicum]
MISFTILELRAGRTRPLGDKGHVSAIDKQRTNGLVHVGPEGLEDDEQADRRHHGGRDKALHAYPLTHYPSWAAELPQQADRFVPGGFGENFVVDGITEQDLCLGDRFQIGPVLVELSQSRQPCWKLNLRFNRPDMARRVQSTGRTGWYFRVLRTGDIQAGCTAELVDRPNPDWPLTRVADLLYQSTNDSEALAEFARLPELPDNWRRLVDRRIRSKSTEDWRRRLLTPTQRKVDH